LGRMFVIALQIALAVCMVGLRTLGMGMEFTAVLGDATCFLDDQTIRADGPVEIPSSQFQNNLS
jgi:hypothetical protein